MTSTFALLILLSIVAVGRPDKREFEVEEVNCAKVRVELAFVADASSSITGDDFSLEKRFIADVSTSFDIGQDNTRIGLVAFASGPEIVFGFSKHNNSKDVEGAIKNMKQLTGVTALGAAIKLAGEGVMKEARPGIPKYIIVITDGQNNKWPATHLVTPALKEGGITFISVGIGDSVDADELKGISSSNSFYNVSAFSGLNTIVADIKNDICKVKVKYQYSTCETEGDIAFIIDQTNRPYWTPQIYLLSKLFERFEISPKKQRVALVVDGYGTIVGLDKFSNREDYINYTTYADIKVSNQNVSGMLAADKELTANRQNVSKLVVLFRSHQSQSHSDDLNAALTLRNRGSNVLPIGLGPDVNENNLNELSSTKKIIHPVILNWDDSHVNEMSEIICQNLKNVYKECSGKQMDLVFVLDSSSSVGPDNWLKQSQFVTRIVSMLDVNNSTTRVGAVYFNSEPYLGFEIGKFNNKKDYNDALLNLPFSEGATAIGSALKLAQQQLALRKRKEAVSVIVLVTDGKSNVGLKPEVVASSIKDEGTHIICIGITDLISKEQLQMLSSTKEVYEITDFDALEKFAVETLTKEACQAIKNEKVKCVSPLKTKNTEL